jgi:hypothetical protein
MVSYPTVPRAMLGDQQLSLPTEAAGPRSRSCRVQNFLCGMSGAACSLVVACAADICAESSGTVALVVVPPAAVQLYKMSRAIAHKFFCPSNCNKNKQMTQKGFMGRHVLCSKS